MGASYVECNDGNFKEEVVESDIPVLVDFWAPWCAPCRAIAPHVEALATEFADRLKVVKVNVDESPATAAGYGIRGIPTLLVFKSGEVANQLVGNPPNARAKLKTLVEAVM